MGPLPNLPHHLSPLGSPQKHPRKNLCIPLRKPKSYRNKISQTLSICWLFSSLNNFQHTFLKNFTSVAQKEKTTHLVGGWTNPSEKYARQIGSFPQVGVKIKNVWNHHPVMFWCIYIYIAIIISFLHLAPGWHSARLFLANQISK